jgi:hypothetical protein
MKSVSPERKSPLCQETDIEQNGPTKKEQQGKPDYHTR